MTDVKAIAKEVVKELKRGQSIVVTASDIALMLADPTFPPCVSLVEGGTRRYLRKDVERWIERKFQDESRLALQTFRA